MHKGILAIRREQALKRIAEAAAVLAKRVGGADGAAALQAATHRNPEIAIVFKLEAVADVLDAWADRLVVPVTGPQEEAPPAEGAAAGTPPVATVESSPRNPGTARQGKCDEPTAGDMPSEPTKEKQATKPPKAPKTPKSPKAPKAKGSK